VPPANRRRSAGVLLVMRNGDRGPVTVTDPFVRESWLRRHQHGEGDIERSSLLG
jgi:hypothetical protein